MGNWNLSLPGSLLCPHLRGIYNNVEAFGSFTEAFTVCNARKQRRPSWYGKYSSLVTLIAKMMDTCTPATYNATKWKTNPAEIIHVIRTHEAATAPNPGEAGADNLRHLLHGTVPDTDSPPAPEPVPETPEPSMQAPKVTAVTETPVPETPPPVAALPLQLLDQQPVEQAVDHTSSSHSDDVKMLTPRESAQPAAIPPASTHRLIGGHRVRPPPSPSSRSGSSASVGEETGTARWMRKNGTPSRVRGERAKEISKALTQLLRHAAPRLGIRMQEDGYVDMGALLRAPRFWNQWITEAEVIDVIHYNQKHRFEVCFQQGRYQVRALQGHSISHVRDELVLTRLSIEDTPEYAAHGTYYDFYESILRRGLMAGGQQGQSFRRHVHMAEQLPWEGAISGMRSDCDLLVIWIRTREAAASGVRFFRSANEVLLTEDTEATIDSAFFQSVQILRSSEVLTADGGPPHPQQVALAISRAPTRDTQRSGRYMMSSAPDYLLELYHVHVHVAYSHLTCRTLRNATKHQGPASSLEFTTPRTSELATGKS